MHVCFIVLRFCALCMLRVASCDGNMLHAARLTRCVARFRSLFLLWILWILLVCLHALVCAIVCVCVCVCVCACVCVYACVCAVTWGTSPQDVVPITGAVPDPAAVADPAHRAAMERALKCVVWWWWWVRLRAHAAIFRVGTYACNYTAFTRAL